MTRAPKARSQQAVPSIEREFVGARLGDKRRTKRLRQFADAFCAAPDRSLPQIARDEAELEGIYRFVESDAFGFDDILAPHLGETSARLADSPTTLVVHDISDCTFPSRKRLRAGLARVSDERQGFRLQASLAVAGDGSNRPLGLLWSETWTDPMRGRTEARRWGEFIEKSRRSAAGRSRLIHVIDREGAAYELFHEVMAAGDGFVIRLVKQRVVEFEDAPGVAMKIRDAANRLESLYEVMVPLAKRTRTFEDKVNPPRDARIARLSFAATAIRLKKPWLPNHPEPLPKSIVVNLVSVKEISPPEGEEPVEWLLATTEPIATLDDVARVVEIYRARWMIEEFFKALKTGCALEKRQLESMDALEKVLAISLVVAWRILLLRFESRRDPGAPATVALSDLEIQVLRATGRVALAERPSAHDALLAVAALGGHIRNNGRPGWLVLGRGMERLLERVVGWTSALAMLGEAAKM